MMFRLGCGQESSCSCVEVGWDLLLLFSVGALFCGVSPAFNAPTTYCGIDLEDRVLQSVTSKRYADVKQSVIRESKQVYPSIFFQSTAMPTITDVDSDEEGTTMTVQQSQSQYDDIDDMDYELPPVSAPSSSSSTSKSKVQVNPFTASLASSFADKPNIITTDEASRFKHYQVIYPIYIDARFAHKNGERRVSKARAVKYPKAQEIAEVCGRVLGLAPVFEPEKTHPRDWQNPGRVRILIKDKASGRLLNPAIKDSTLTLRSLCLEFRAHAISTTEYTLLQKLCDGIRLLRSHAPTDPSSILFKLPYHSPAISYGTLDEALKGGGKMQEMMKGMLGGGMPGAAGAIGAGGNAPGQDEAEAKRKADERELAEKQKMAKLKALNKQGRRMGRR
jgi:signal recognition particle subunit SRP19